MKTVNKYRLTIFLILFLLIIWEIFVQLGKINTRILPPPSQFVLALFTDCVGLMPHVWQTFIETVIGFIIATLLGFFLAILLDISPKIKRTVYPLLVVSQTVPIIALAPLLLLWFGFGILPKIIIVVLYCFFPIAIAGADGLAQTKKQFMKLLKSMNASYWQGLWLVRLPSSLPSFFSGLKIAATYSVAGAIVGEYVGAYQGLGVYMQRAANSYSIALVFASIFLTITLSFIILITVMIVESFYKY
ncbi:ABC transporter permease [bacterium]|nr:MAG: ABC transporter permease [bacterium]